LLRDLALAFTTLIGISTNDALGVHQAVDKTFLELVACQFLDEVTNSLVRPSAIVAAG